MTPPLRELEQMVVEAWPAGQTEALDGWLLRSSGGPTHRGNSAATLAAGSALSLRVRLERTEQWYGERGQRAMIQVGPCAAPADLDSVLTERGYQKAGAAVLALAPARQVAERTQSELQTRVESTPSAAWLGIAEGSSRHASTKDIFRGFLSRLGPRCRFVTAWVGPDEPAAIGLGVLSKDWLGIYSMHTRPELRRRGAARAVLGALAQGALAQGQRNLYLLVEPSNPPARALYAQSAFEDAYGYHYRIQGTGPAEGR